MTQIKTQQLKADAAGISQAAKLLRAGNLVAFPTETVYGLGGNALDGQAVARIYEAKGRPSFNPLIVHVPDVATAKRYADWSDQADQLASAFWPGALTLVLPLRPNTGLSSLVTAGLNSVAIRIPAHALARKLLKTANIPVAAPSANPSGKISPTTAQHVLSGLSGRITAVLDGGACPVGVESTIIGLTGKPQLLRAGGVAREDIEAILGTSLHDAQHVQEDQISAPGQMTSHYAPGARVRLNATQFHTGELRLGFGPVDCDLNLSPKGDLLEAASNLFGHLHELDEKDAATIAVSPIPLHGLGAAINDRLARAAAPRD